MSLLDALPRAKSPLGEGSSSQEGRMKVSPSKYDQDLRSLVDVETISVLKKGRRQEVLTQSQQRHLKYLMERRMEHLLQGGILLHSCKEFQKGLTHQDLGTMHGQHVLSLPSGEILKVEEGREEEEHLKKKSIHPSLFQGLEGQQNICSKDEDKSVHPHPQSTLCLDVSLFGGIPPWSSHDEQKSKVSPQPCASMPSLFKGEANTTWETFGKKHAYVNHSFLYDCMHYFTFYM